MRRAPGLTPLAPPGPEGIADSGLRETGEPIGSSERDRAPAHVALRSALPFWLKLGCTSFGGPAAQIALMHEELVERRRWISERRFLHALNYCMMLPGPEAQQLATYLGWLMHRRLGGILAGILFVLPSLLLLILLSWIYVRFGDLPQVSGVFYGVKPAVTALVIHAAQRMGQRTLTTPLLCALAAAAFLAIFLFQTPFPVLVALAAATGFLASALAGTSPHTTHEESHRRATGRTSLQARAALIDDDTQRSEHTRFHWGRLAQVLAAGALLWLLPFCALGLLFGWHHTFTQMGWFFTKAAWLTFGGAYAVLPYVYQGAVVNFGWLTAPQMMDGLALGETTPGPLIIVVAFVGFVGAATHAALGPDWPMLGGVLGATVVTWFTFLPSFILVLAGGPLIESSRGIPKLEAPLRAVTAAVVGVIANLAVFFALHVLWPHRDAVLPATLVTAASGFDWFALALMLGASAALILYKGNVMLVIAVCGVLGLARQLWLT